MSRSRKKFPCIKDYCSTTKRSKRWASKKVRHTVYNYDYEDMMNGRYYRKLFDSWDIFDLRLVYKPHFKSDKRLYIKK